ncbi:OmpA family protein [Gelidibacter sp.]|uniref:OmpA family protein n=1 Tax=Gelidibacter sp. TaxID=2018083 RepID=UPI0032665329
MNNKINLNKGSLFARSLYIKGLILSALIIVGIQGAVQAQENQYSAPSWYFGVAGGANFNFFDGSTNQLSSSLTPPAVFNKGNGIGLFIAPSIEYYKPNTRFGFILQAGYDSRKGDFDQVLTDCNCPADLSADLSYITVEPSLRFAPFKSNLYLYAGPRVAFVQNKSYTYQLGVNPSFPNQVKPEADEGDFNEVKGTIISGQIGAGYDIPLSSKGNKTQFVMSPFVAFHPYFGQTPRSIETWNVTTIRAGVVLKLGVGSKILPLEEEVVEPIVPKVVFTVDSPKNVPGRLSIAESFPLLNYIYFDQGSTAISNRYVLLDKSQVKDFKEDQVEVLAPSSKISSRSERVMTVYYNILNILGDRMEENPSTTITLVGSSENGSPDGKLMAESVKKYLVDVFEINGNRIAIEGRNKPKTAGEQGASQELIILRESGDRRVSVESSSPELLMEFQNGPNAALKPVKIVGVQDAPISSYVTFKVDGADEAFSTWSIEVTDENGIVQNFGPYTEDEVKISGNNILGTKPEGDYKVKMIGTNKVGEIVTQESNVHIVAWTPSKIEEGIRFSIVYEFDSAEAIAMYNTYLAEIVAPKIPANAKVIIHGHTDIIGEDAYNKNLSVQRANNVQTTLKNSLRKLGTTGVKFEVDGMGENENAAPFGNKLPEERAYNRTVIIDIIPNNK